MPEAAKAPVAPEPVARAPRKMVPLQEMRFKQREFLQNQYAIDAPIGTTMEDLLTREYWGHVARKLRRRDKIVVMTDDCRMYVELIVFAVGSNWAQVRPLPGTFVVLDAAIARSSVADDYEIRDGGLHKKWVVVRLSDGREIKGDGTLQTEDAARAWLRDYLNSQGIRTAA